VRLKLYKGNIIVAGHKSPKTLYDPKIATMESDASKLRPKRRDRIHSAEGAAAEITRAG